MSQHAIDALLEVTPGRYVLMSGELIETPDTYEPRHARPRRRPPYETGGDASAFDLAA